MKWKLAKEFGVCEKTIGRAFSFLEGKFVVTEVTTNPTTGQQWIGGRAGPPARTFIAAPLEGITMPRAASARGTRKLQADQRNGRVKRTSEHAPVSGVETTLAGIERGTRIDVDVSPKYIGESVPDITLIASEGGAGTRAYQLDPGDLPEDAWTSLLAVPAPAATDWTDPAALAAWITDGLCEVPEKALPIGDYSVSPPPSPVGGLDNSSGLAIVSEVMGGAVANPEAAPTFSPSASLTPKPAPALGGAAEVVSFPNGASFDPAAAGKVPPPKRPRTLEEHYEAWDELNRLRLEQTKSGATQSGSNSTRAGEDLVPILRSQVDPAHAERIRNLTHQAWALLGKARKAGLSGRQRRLLRQNGEGLLEQVRKLEVEQWQVPGSVAAELLAAAPIGAAKTCAEPRASPPSQAPAVLQHDLLTYVPPAQPDTDKTMSVARVPQIDAPQEVNPGAVYILGLASAVEGKGPGESSLQQWLQEQAKRGTSHVA